MEYKMSETTPTLNLQSLLVPSKVTEVDYPGLPDFKIQVSFLSREELVKIRKKATKTSYKHRQPVEELNEDLFLQLYVENTIRLLPKCFLKTVNRYCIINIKNVT